MPNLPMDPFLPEDYLPSPLRTSEFGFGSGMFPDPAHSEDHDKGMFPYEPPSREDQVMEMAAIKRMNTNDPAAQPDYYVAGNPDRYGPQKPLVRERGYPKSRMPKAPPANKFRRAE
jgi:hypothetical protein